jgi:DNA-binding NtrC family response regulator
MKKLRIIEEEAIRYALIHAEGCMTRAARNLGIGRSTLYRKINDYGIVVQSSRESQTTRPIIYASPTDNS